MCDKVEKPMPEGANKNWAGILKIFIAVAAIGDMIYFGVTNHSSKDDDSDSGTTSTPVPELAPKPDFGSSLESDSNSQTGCEWISLLLTLADFGLSCAVGYGLYSPMSTSDDSDYAKMIADTSEACGRYTVLWILKTVAALFVPSLNLLVSSGKVALEEEQKKMFDQAGFVNSLVGGGLALTSAVMEIIACAEASKVSNDKLTGDQKKDKTCFLVETSGYIVDDARAVVDTLIDVLKVENTLVIVGREVLATGYLGCMIAEAAIIF
jgi:hypothetical protein